MFTGIVEEVGYVKAYNSASNGAVLVVACRKITEDMHIGDSICINGVCETVVDFDKESFSVNISNETLNVTNFSSLKSGDRLNLERALTLQSRLGGHIVSGHIDCVAQLVSVEKLDDYYNLEFKFPHEVGKYIVYKGSIAINGISLTVCEVYEDSFKVAIIPHTFKNTVLKDLSVGSFVNIETDILGRYVEKMLSLNNNVDTDSRINIEFLQENGFV